MNHLPNGTVLPHGLIGHSSEYDIGAFNKAYRNTALRMGIIVRSYDVSDIENSSKLTTEYDVQVFEQNEDRGSTVITYRNCLSAEGMGSIADFFEKTLRVKENSSSKVIDTKNQNGAVVLLLCLDGMPDKSIIIGSVTHPDRTSTLIGQEKHLEGEFNGVNIKVNQDGSASFTFQGQTDNNGKVVDSSQGNTVVSVLADGSFQVQHSTITFSMARSGQCNITASQMITVDAPTIKLGANATEAVIKGNLFKQLFDAHVHPTPVGSSGPPSQPLDPSALSKKVKTE